MSTSSGIGAAQLAAGLVCAFCAVSAAQTVSVPATANITTKRFMGHFAGGLSLQISASGTVELYDPNLLLTRPDGSLAAPFFGPVITWANEGDAYPNHAGGDGINHYPGGGTNWTGTVFNSLGAPSTDTTNSATVRFGTLVGTFSDSPAAADWFVVGLGRTVATPATGGRLYLAVTDCVNCEADNTGSYSATMAGAAVAAHSLADQFTEAANPNGAWRYGFKAAADAPGTFTAFTTHYAGYLGTIEGWNGATQIGNDLPGVAYNRSQTSNQDCCTTWLPGELNIHPGASHDGVVRFTAPSAGFYRVGGWLRGLSFGGTSSGAILHHRGQAVFSASVTGFGTVVPIAYQVLELAAGETLDLIITKGPNGTHASDSTGVNLLIGPAQGELDGAAVTLAGGAHLRADSAATINPAQFTLEAWIRPDAVGLGVSDDAVGAALINKPREGAVGLNLASWGLHWSHWNQRVLFYVTHQFGVSSSGVISNATIPIGTVAHCAASFDGTTLRLYINGQLDNSVTATSANVFYANDMPVLIGAGNFGSIFSRRFQGLLDGVRIWGRARSAVEIAGTFGCGPEGSRTGLIAEWNFDGATLADTSGNGRHATSATPSGSALAFVEQPNQVDSPCPADFNCSGSLSVQDIFDFLAAYFGNNARADFNDSGATSVQDIFDFLAAYFAGCP